MRELLPFEVYAKRGASPVRTALLAWVLFTIPFRIFAHVKMSQYSPRVQMIVAVTGAGIAAVFFTVMILRAMRDLVRSIHAGDPTIAPPPPAGYDARMTCSLVRGITLGGHLYVGGEGWIFMPHLKNLPQHQQPVALGIPSPDGVSVIPAPAWTRLLAGRSRRVRIHTSIGEYKLVVPDAFAAATALLPYARACAPVAVAAG